MVGRLHIQVATGELVSSPRPTVLSRHADCLNQVTRPGQRELGADAEEGRQDHALEELPRVEIDVVGETSIARTISRRHIERTSVWQNNTLPDDRRPFLPEGDNAVVRSDQPRPLGNEKDAARCAVIGVLGHLRRN